jgi:hypothetical protein
METFAPRPAGGELMFWPLSPAFGAAGFPAQPASSSEAAMRRSENTASPRFKSTPTLRRGGIKTCPLQLDAIIGVVA